MSVLIKGMEMPTSCAECRLMADGWCYSVGLEQREKISTVKRPTWCPLVPVPKHGRCIDADALMKEMDKQENAMFEHGHEFSFSFKSGGDVCTAWYNVEMMVEDAPTIIPASEEGDADI